MRSSFVVYILVESVSALVEWVLYRHQRSYLVQRVLARQIRCPHSPRVIRQFRRPPVPSCLGPVVSSPPSPFPEFVRFSSPVRSGL